MGSPLPADKWQKADGSAYLSGTEYEIEDALRAEPGPDVLLYRRSEEPRWGARDPELVEKKEQLSHLDSYVESLKSAARYVSPYAIPNELKEPLKRDLRKVLARRLPSSASEIADTFQGATPAAVGDERLAQAETLLGDIPLETVPLPAPLPARSHMPHARNGLFVGREGDRKAHASALKAGETAAVGQVATVTGLGGIGKTQLASEFVHRYGQHFAGGVFWVSFADPEAVPAEISARGGSGGMALREDFDRQPLEEQVRRVAAEWQSPLPRLLAFDNCEDEALLEIWRPRSGGCRVLVTSRRDTWSPHLGVHRSRFASWNEPRA